MAMLEKRRWGPEGEENGIELANMSVLERQRHPLSNGRCSIREAVKRDHQEARFVRGAGMSSCRGTSCRRRRNASSFPIYHDPNVCWICHSVACSCRPCFGAGFNLPYGSSSRWPRALAPARVSTTVWSNSRIPGAQASDPASPGAWKPGDGDQNQVLHPFGRPG